MATEIKKIVSRRDTAANWQSNNPVLANGEIGVDTTNRVMKIGDGVIPWGSLGHYDGTLGTEEPGLYVTDRDGYVVFSITQEGIKFVGMESLNCNGGNTDIFVDRLGLHVTDSDGYVVASFDNSGFSAVNIPSYEIFDNVEYEI